MVENAGHPTAGPAFADEESRAIRILLKQVRRGQAIDWDSATRECPLFMSRYGDGIRSLQRSISTGHRPTDTSGDLSSKKYQKTTIDALSTALPGYEILLELGRGGQGVVYEAVQTAAKRRVALKVLLAGPFASHAQHGRFEREIELAARLRHPGIVQVFETGIAAGQPFFAMELVDGLPIDDHALLFSLSLRDIVEQFVLVADAISHAHQRGVIHRDLKPSNILIEPAGEPRILDFGLAKELGVESDRTITGQVLGTPPYAAPEQALGLRNEIDVRTDLYSLGVVLFKTITGAFPYPVTGTTRQILDAITTQPPKRLRQAIMDELDPGFRRLDGLNEDLERIVQKALSKEPHRRYQSADAFAQDLRRYLAGDAVEARSGNSAYVLSKTLKRFRVPISVAALLVLVLIGSLVGVTAARRQAVNVASIAQSGLHAASFLRIGQVHRDAGRADDAIQMLNRAVEIASKSSPNHPLIREQLFASHFALAEIYLDRGDIPAMEQNVSIAENLAKGMQSSEPDCLRLQRLRAFSHWLRATNAAAVEQWGAALDEIHVAEPVFRRLLLSSEVTERVRFDLARLLFDRSQYEYRLGDLNSSQATCEESRDLLQILHAENASYAPYAVELSRHESELAFLNLKRGNSDNDVAAALLLSQATERLIALSPEVSGSQYGSEIVPLLRAINQNQKIAEQRLRSTVATSGR